MNWKTGWTKGQVQILGEPVFSEHRGTETRGSRHLAKSDRLVTRWTCSGESVGDMFSIKRTGQQVLFAGMKTMTVRNGRIIEAWIVRDDLDPGRHVGAVK